MSQARRNSAYRRAVGWGKVVLHPRLQNEEPAAAENRGPVHFEGTLNDVQSACGSELLHVMWGCSSQGIEQGRVRSLVGRRVRVTIEEIAE